MRAFARATFRQQAHQSLASHAETGGAPWRTMAATHFWTQVGVTKPHKSQRNAVEAVDGDFPDRTHR